MGNVSLTWVTISIVAFIATFWATQSAYTQFNLANGGNISQDYIDKYGQITSYNNSLSSFGENSAASILGSSLQVANTLVQTVFNIGLSAIKSLGTITLVSKDMLVDIGNTYPELSIFFWFVTLSLSIYLAYRLLQSLRGSVVET